MLRQILDFWRNLDPELKKAFWGIIKMLVAGQAPAVGPGSFTASPEGQQFADEAEAIGVDRAEAEEVAGKLQQMNP